MDSPIKWGLILLITVSLMVASYGYYEVERYSAKYRLCESDYNINFNFTRESICTSHPMASAFHLAGLINCSKAEEKITETPRLCALHNWYMTSWMERLLQVVFALYERSTNMIMLLLVIPLSAVAIIYFYIKDKGKTDRHALTVDTQHQPIEDFARILELMQPKAPLLTSGGTEHIQQPKVMHLKRVGGKGKVMEYVD